MLKMLFTLILVAFVGLSSAQSTTQGTANLFGLQDYAELFIASVIDSDGTDTTYLVGCPLPPLTRSLGSDYCNIDFGTPFQITQGHHFFRKQMIDYNDYFDRRVVSLCYLDGTTTAACLVETVDNVQDVYATADEVKIMSAIFTPVPLVRDSKLFYTTGMSLFPSAVPGTTTAAPAAAVASGASVSTSYTMTTRMSQAGMPQATGQAPWVVGGVAAAVVAAGLQRM